MWVGLVVVEEVVLGGGRGDREGRREELFVWEEEEE